MILEEIEKAVKNWIIKKHNHEGFFLAPVYVIKEFVKELPETVSASNPLSNIVGAVTANAFLLSLHQKYGIHIVT